MKNQVNATLSDEDYELFKDISEKENRSMRGQVKHIIEKYIKEYNSPVVNKESPTTLKLEKNKNIPTFK